MIYLPEEFIDDQPEILLYFQEANFFCSFREKNKIYDLFSYLVKRHYEYEAAVLWDETLTNNNQVKAS